MMQRSDLTGRKRLPQLDGGLFLTDGGLETTLIFHEGWDLPIGEAFVLMESEKGRDALRAYFDRYLPMAVKHGVGFILESPTWRANPDWAAKAGYGRDRLAELNHAGIDLMREVRAKYETARTPIVISGCIGPRGDGYDPGALMSVEEATAYHAWQIGIFREANVDFVSAFTMTNVNEALGVVRAAQAADMPSVISFTLETDGRLPTGESLGRSDREGGPGNRQRTGLLHDQLRPSDAFCRCTRCRGVMDRAAARGAGELVVQEPRRAR